MKKITFKIFLVSILIIFSFLIYVSTIGIKTDKFNNQILNQIKTFDNNLNVELNEVNIFFVPLKLKVNLKLLEQILFIKKKRSNLQVSNQQFQLSHYSIINFY